MHVPGPTHWKTMMQANQNTIAIPRDRACASGGSTEIMGKPLVMTSLCARACTIGHWGRLSAGHTCRFNLMCAVRFGTSAEWKDIPVITA